MTGIKETMDGRVRLIVASIAMRTWNTTSTEWVVSCAALSRCVQFYKVFIL